MNKSLYKLFLYLFVFLQVGFVLLRFPQVAEVADLTSASDTLSNSRLSYRALVSSGTSGSSVVTIQSGSGDSNTSHLFPGDVVCFADAGLNGCKGSTTYTVSNIVDSTNFNISTPLGTTLTGTDFVIATQSAIHTVAFTTATTIPTNGSVLITVPSIDVTGKTNDGFPDTNSATSTNGFDLASLGTSNVSIASSGCANNWTITSVTAGTSSTNHTILISRNTNSCASGSTLTVTIGDGTKKLINPAPISSGHTQGTADVYKILVETRDNVPNNLDSVYTAVAPVEAVFISATVDQTLSFSIAAVAAAQTRCGATTSVATTATSVPWGTITTVNSFLNAAHLLTVSTNAASGYSVKVEENDQMGKSGITCTGGSAGPANSCIPDTTCDGGTCTSATSAEWTTATNNGLGFSLANSSGTDASFLYNESARTFSSRQFPDQENSETKQNVMSNAGAVSGSAVNVCYRITVGGTQPAGYYYNIVKYTATPIF